MNINGGNIQTKDLVKGWVLLSAGAMMISFAGGMVWTIPAGLAIGGAWVIVYGISVLSGCGIRKA